MTVFLGVAVVVVCLSVAAQAATAVSSKPHIGFPLTPLAYGSVVPPPRIDKHPHKSPFVEPISLKPAIAFWKKIFVMYGESQVVLHHRNRLDQLYVVLDFTSFQKSEIPDEKAELKRLRYALIDVARQDIVEAATRQANQDKTIAMLTADVRKQPDLIRAQTGIRERYTRAIEIAPTYMPYMEQLFVDADLPVELSRLPFIESSFDIQATSSVGAAGIWQFMKDTGKLYLTIDAIRDERRDPLIATVAATRFFKRMYSQLQAWPLVVNAYNAGPGRLLQAVATLGTKDIGEIIARYNHPSYQFASRNFYPEFLAAVSIYTDRHRLFPTVREAEPLRYDSLMLDRAVSLPTLATLSDVSLEELRALNPALHASLFESAKLLPAQVPFRVPYLSGKAMLEKVKGMTASSEKVLK